MLYILLGSQRPRIITAADGLAITRHERDVQLALELAADFAVRVF